MKIDKNITQDQRRAINEVAARASFAAIIATKDAKVAEAAAVKAAAAAVKAANVAGQADHVAKQRATEASAANFYWNLEN